MHQRSQKKNCETFFFFLCSACARFPKGAISVFARTSIPNYLCFPNFKVQLDECGTRTFDSSGNNERDRISLQLR